MASLLHSASRPQLAAHRQAKPQLATSVCSTSYSHTAACSWRTLQAGRRPARLVFARDSASGLSRSFDSEEDLDMGLAADLAVAADPERMKKLAKSLDMAWTIRKLGAHKMSRPDPCATCRGFGEKECDWCHGTGYMMIGDKLIRNEANASRDCPVCKGRGACKCEKCVGTGWRAKWIPDMP